MSTLITTLTQPTLVTWLLKATALLVLALAVTGLLRRASAGTRHLVWLATLAGILALPALPLWAPRGLAILPVGLVPTLAQVATPNNAVVPVVPSITNAPTAAVAGCTPPATQPPVCGPFAGSHGATREPARYLIAVLPPAARHGGGAPPADG